MLFGSLFVMLKTLCEFGIDLQRSFSSTGESVCIDCVSLATVVGRTVIGEETSFFLPVVPFRNNEVLLVVN